MNSTSAVSLKKKRFSEALIPILVLAPLLLTPCALPAGGDEATAPEVPEAIETEGVPNVPPALWTALKPFLDVNYSSFMGWDPSGKGILIGTRHENLRQLHHVASPGAVPTLLTRGDEPVRRGRYLADGSIALMRSAGGNEQYQIYRLNPNNGQETLLTDGESRNVMHRSHPDGQRVAMSSTRRNGRDADIFLQAIKGGAPDPLFEVNRESWSLSAWSPDGKRAVLSRYISLNETHARILDVETKKTTDVRSEITAGSTMKAEGIARFQFGFGPEGKHLFFTSNARGEFLELTRLRIEDGKTTWLTGDLSRDIEDVELSPDRQSLAFIVNVDGYSELFVLEDILGDSPKRRAVPIGRHTVGSMRFSPDGGRLGLTLGGPKGAPEAFTIELSTGKLTRWTFSNRDNLVREADVVEPELIHYASFDGRKVPAFVYLPPGDKKSEPVPVLIKIHGGPESQFRPWFSSQRHFLSGQLGVAIIAPNVRGSIGYGKTYSLLDNGRKREDSVRDIGALLDWIRDHGASEMHLDPGRVAVTGSSYGGYMVLASLVRYGDRLRAGIDSIGISDFITFLENTKPYRRLLRRAEYGDESDPEMRRFFESISPLRQMNRLRSALFLIHGKNDPRVPFSEALQVVERARATGKEVWTLYADNEGHGFRRKENRNYRTLATVLFLKRFLLPKDGPELEKRRELEKELANFQQGFGRAYHDRARLFFQLERFEESLADYDRAIATTRPHDEDSCWERGLIYYYLDRFDDGRRQFEGYHKVGPLDIENGIWRYLCIAEKEGLEKALETFHAYPDKRRVPFPALHALFSGTGSVQAVLNSVGDGERQTNQTFYAHYYVGKYFEVKRDFPTAQKHFEKALEYKIEHFMYDCAVVDARRNRKRF